MHTIPIENSAISPCEDERYLNRAAGRASRQIRNVIGESRHAILDRDSWRENPRRKIENFAASVDDEYREKAIWESRDGLVPWMQHVQGTRTISRVNPKNIKALSGITNIK